VRSHGTLSLNRALMAAGLVDRVQVTLFPSPAGSWRAGPLLAIPALVVHGRRDPFFPVGNSAALAREISGARLLVLERAATAIPDVAAGEVAAPMLEL
jgi:pimeloyl-ACP methyl ester carboxylesterase